MEERKWKRSRLAAEFLQKQLCRTNPLHPSAWFLSPGETKRSLVELGVCVAALDAMEKLRLFQVTKLDLGNCQALCDLWRFSVQHPAENKHQEQVSPLLVKPSHFFQSEAMGWILCPHVEEWEWEGFEASWSEDPTIQEGEGKINHEMTLTSKMCPYSEHRNTVLSFFGEYTGRKMNWETIT